LIPYFLIRRERPRFGYLIDAIYDGKRGVIRLSFLDPVSQTIFFWYDNTGHHPYLLTSASKEEIEELIGERGDYLGSNDVTKYDSIKDENVILRKVYASNPLAIGGDFIRKGNFRSVLSKAGHNVWEARKQYFQCFCFDMRLEMGMPYLVSEKNITPFKDVVVEKRIEKTLRELNEKHRVPDTEELRFWLKIFEYPFFKPKFITIDIEVQPEDSDRMPNPQIAKQPIIAVSFVDSEDKKEVFLLKRSGTKSGNEELKNVYFFDKEEELISTTFKKIDSFPFVVTFNGDNFDLLYLSNRAECLGLRKKWNPIIVQKKQCKLKRGIHIDLYHFFKIRAIQIYSFKSAYKDFKLDSISKALLKKSKIIHKKPIELLSYSELKNYCLRDAELTQQLLTFNDNTVFNLILSLTRMSNLPIGELIRRNLSDWIRSTLFYFLTKKNILIPSRDQLRMKGGAQTKPKIKGKKYEGAIVRKPNPGVFFDVKVLDFASLYPSEIKLRNIGFSTVDCPHEDCKVNVVPYTKHWICMKNRAIEADAIGSLRDIRVFLYKPRAKDPLLPKELRVFYGALEQSIKVFLNGHYGIFGYEKFALYTPGVAETTTAYARKHMTILMKKSEEAGIVVLGGDTDSCFLYKPSEEQIRKLKEEIMEELGLDLGIDKIYRYAVFSHRKKNYLGVFEDGTVDIKGLTGKKSNIPEIIKKPFFRAIKILSSVKNMEEFTEAKKSILELEIETYNKIKNRKWEDVSELAFHTRLSRDPDSYETNPQHVKAAKMLRELGHEVRGGDLIHYIKATNEDGVMPVFDTDSEMVDTDAYIEQLRSVFDQVTEVLGIDFEKDVLGKKTMDDYIYGDTNISQFLS